MPEPIVVTLSGPQLWNCFRAMGQAPGDIRELGELPLSLATLPLLATPVKKFRITIEEVKEDE
jgi:hypothetical protein